MPAVEVKVPMNREVANATGAIADDPLFEKSGNDPAAEISQTDQVSKRVRKKAEKLQRIKDAALALFLTKGFDDATTREIAKIAGVALGTLFNYAENKRDLLFLICNDELEATVVEAEQGIDPALSFLDNVLSIAEYHFVHFARRPEISRYALREMYFYSAGKQVGRFKNSRDNLVTLFRRVVEANLDNGAISSSDSAETVTSIIYALYQTEVRTYLGHVKPDPDAAKDRFAQQIKILLKGLGPKDEAFVLKRHRQR